LTAFVSSAAARRAVGGSAPIEREAVCSARSTSSRVTSSRRFGRVEEPWVDGHALLLAAVADGIRVLAANFLMSRSHLLPLARERPASIRAAS
jgi:hypothetical protein